MKKVKKTSYHTLKQLISMAENLKEKFNKYSSIQTSVNVHPEITYVEYWVYIEDKIGRHAYSWKELFSLYDELMKGDDNG